MLLNRAKVSKYFGSLRSALYSTHPLKKFLHSQYYIIANVRARCHMKRLTSSLLICIALLGCTDYSDKPKEIQTRERISIAYGDQPSAVLISSAIESKAFQLVNLDIDPIVYPSGKMAIEASIEGKVSPDVIVASDIAFLANHELLPEYKIIATAYESDNINVIVSLHEPKGAHDSSLLSSANNLRCLENRTLCTQKLSALHFFGQVLVERNNVTGTSYKYYKVNELNEKLLSGECDAITSREPFISELKRQTNSNELEIIQFPGVYLQYELILLHNRISDKLAERLLKGLMFSEEHATANSQYPGSIIEVSLHQTLIPLFDRELEWIEHLHESAPLSILHEHSTHHTNSYPLVRTAPLENISPHRVTVIVYED